MTALTGNTRSVHPTTWPLLGFTALALLFVAKPFHLDDPMYLWAARRIIEDPFDFYGFVVNWNSTAEWMPKIMMNPPLASFWLAIAGSFSGWSERAVHLWMLVPALLALLGTSRLADELGAPGWLAALLTASSPGFFVSSTTVMCDVTMIAAWVWSVTFWIRGMRENRHAFLATGAVLAAASALSKYFGLALMPLLLTYSLARERRIGAWLSWLLIPLGTIAAYELYSAHLYRVGLLAGAAGYVLRDTGLRRDQVARTVTALSFTGGCVVNLGLLAPAVFSRRSLVAGALAGAALLGVLLAVGAVGPFPLVSDRGVRAGVAAQLAFFAVVGVGLVALAVGTALRDRTPESLLLALWIVGTVLFAGWVNWSTNVRAVLPLVPAAAILLARRLSGALAENRSRVARWWPHAASIALSVALSVALAFADQQLARAGRDAATQLAAELKERGATVWFQGHWGFQYYAQQLGLVPFDYRRSTLRPGDLMIVPGMSSKLIPLPGEAISIVKTTSWPTMPGLATWSYALGAAFYADVWGPLPFAFGRTEPEYYAVVRIVRKIEP